MRKEKIEIEVTLYEVGDIIEEHCEEDWPKTQIKKTPYQTLKISELDHKFTGFDPYYKVRFRVVEVMEEKFSRLQKKQTKQPKRL